MVMIEENERVKEVRGGGGEEGGGGGGGGGAMYRAEESREYDTPDPWRP